MKLPRKSTHSVRRGDRRTTGKSSRVRSTFAEAHLKPVAVSMIVSPGKEIGQPGKANLASVSYDPPKPLEGRPWRSQDESSGQQFC